MTLLLKSREIKPYPALSCAVAKYLIKELAVTKVPRMIIEYGSGGSTLYYLDNILEQNQPTLFVSVEFRSSWYEKLIEQIRRRYQNLSNEQLLLRNWSKEKCKLYFKADNKTIMNIPDEIKLLDITRESVKKELLLNEKDDNFPFVDGDYLVFIKGKLIEFKYFLRTDFFKDQFGESPVKDDYINVGIDEATTFLKGNLNGSIIFIIDGGPRIDILQVVFDLMKKHPKASFLIFIHDAYRLYYQKILSRYPDGSFIIGSGNETLGGGTVFNLANEKQMNKLDALLYMFEYGTTSPKMEFLLKKEAWIYENNIRRK